MSVASRPGLRAGAHRCTLVALAVALTTMMWSLTPSGLARAHTGFESSTPADGSVVDEPVGVVTISFTGEADPVGDEFVALDATGVIREPVSVTTLDDRTFDVTFDPPLAGGEIGLRWNVQAADAHPIEGAFSFTVDAPAPTTAPPTTTAPDTSTVPVEQEADATPSDTESGQPVAADDSATPSSIATAAGDSNATATAPNDGTAAQSLDEFLAVDESQPGEMTATFGRLIGFLGVALGLGALTFAATTLRGRRKEIRAVLGAIRILGVVVAVGALFEYVGVSRIGDESLISAWSTAPGFATVLRVVGGIALTVGVAGTISRSRVQRVMRRPSAVRSLSAAVADDLVDRSAGVGESPIVRWTPGARSWPSLLGTILIIASFWFDGHTVNKGFRPLHALVNSVHVAAGAVWVGGVVTMAAIVWSRHREGRPMRVVELVVRFSKVATISLASVVVAGGLMAYLVLDSFGELAGTEWGKILLLKSAAVVLAMIAGAYNHYRLLPALEAEPESPDLLDELRSTLTAEAIMLVFVVIVTAWLVAAAS